MALSSSLWLIYSYYSVEQINKTLKFPSEPKFQHLLIKSSDPWLNVFNRSLMKADERVLADPIWIEALGLCWFSCNAYSCPRFFEKNELKGLWQLLLVSDNHGKKRQSTDIWGGLKQVRRLAVTDLEKHRHFGGTIRHRLSWDSPHSSLHSSKIQWHFIKPLFDLRATCNI